MKREIDCGHNVKKCAGARIRSHAGRGLRMSKGVDSSIILRRFRGGGLPGLPGLELRSCNCQPNT